MDRAEVLYDAFKETFIQIRKLYLINTLLGAFALLILLLVFRDTLLIQNFNPRMKQIDIEVQALNQQLEQLNSDKFSTPTQYRRAKLALDSARLELDTWPKELPARKKMKQKYENYLKEYSGNHEKVIGRLKIDGEPGMDLFIELQSAIAKLEQAKKKLKQEKAKLNKNKRQFTSNVKKQTEQIIEKRDQLLQTRDNLQKESSRIKKDKTRLPWLGLRINPRDILPFLPFLLLLTFHALFDRLDEIFTIAQKPQLQDYHEELHHYPVSVFFGRHNWYSLLVRTVSYLSIPGLQIMATLLIYQNRLSEPMAGIPWTANISIAIVACVASTTYPVVVLWRHRRELFSRQTKQIVPPQKSD